MLLVLFGWKYLSIFFFFTVFGAPQLGVWRSRSLQSTLMQLGRGLKTDVLKDPCRLQTAASMDQFRQQTAAIKDQCTQHTTGFPSRQLKRTKIYKNCNFQRYYRPNKANNISYLYLDTTCDLILQQQKNVSQYL